MEIKMNIDSSQFAETFKELFGNITQEQKDEFSKQILSSWLTEPFNAEREMYERKLIEVYRKKQNTYKHYWDMDDSQIKNDYDFKSDMAKYKSTKDIMVEYVTQAAKEYIHKEVDEAIKNDPQITELKNSIINDLKTNFYKLASDALVLSFVSMLPNLQGQISDLMRNSYMMSCNVDSIKDRMASKGI